MVDEVYWQSARDGYIASFLQKGYWMKALFTNKGEWLFTDVDVPHSDFPKPVIAHFKFPVQKLSDKERQLS